MDVYELINGISSRGDLVAFIRALRVDLADHPDTWENSNLGDYLEAMQGWIQDIKGWEISRGVDISRMNPWQLFAHILLASKLYE
jgi:hypothetical protein